MTSTESNAAIQAIVEQRLAAVEEHVDAELDRLTKLDDDELTALRQKRMDDMKKVQQQKKEWESAGHGEYTEIPEEKEFFYVCKRSKRVVCQFYSDSFFRCKIVDKHLALLAPKHLETKFCKINADKTPFLTQRLNIRVLPTIALVLDGMTVDYVRGFDDLGGTDEFATEVLEARLARSDLLTGVDTKSAVRAATKPKPISVIRDGAKSKPNDDSDEDW